MYKMYVEIDKYRSVLANYVEVKINGEGPYYILTGASDCLDIPEGHCTVIFTCSLKKRTLNFEAKSDVKVKIKWTFFGDPIAEFEEL